MVKITNETGDVKKGRQGEAVYQLHYGQQIRRLAAPKTVPPSKPQISQRQVFHDALTWRKGLNRDNRVFLDGYALANGIIDDYGIALTWDKFALKIALQKPIVILFKPAGD